MLDSRLLHTFVAVADTLHFGRAADRLDMAPSVLSRQIRDLERRLGTRLLTRGRRSAVALTDAGLTLLAESRLALLQLERAEHAARRAARGEIGQLAVGYVASAVLTSVLPDALARLRVARPGVAIELSALETPRQLTALADGTIDVGFLRPRAQYPDGLEVLQIHREGLLLAISTRHRLAHGRISAADLAHERFIVPQFDEGDGFGDHLQQLAAAGGFTLSGTIHVRDFMTAVALAAAGYGLSLVPRSATSLALQGVLYRPIDDFTAEASLAVAFRRNNASAPLRAFIDPLRGARTGST